MLKIIAALSLILATELTVFGQDSVPSAVTPGNTSGDLPYSTQIGTDIEHVELATGNLIINIPFVSLPGRKMVYDFGIRYDASFWMQNYVSTGYYWNVEMRNWLTPTALGWTTNQAYATFVTGTTLCQSLASQPRQEGNDPASFFIDQGGNYTSGFTLTDSQGTKHATYISRQVSGGCAAGSWDINNPSSPDLAQSGWWAPGGLDFRTPSGSALYASGQFSFIDPRNRSSFYTDMAGTVDARGNQQVEGPGGADTVGRRPVALTANGNDLTYTVVDAGGTPRQYGVHLSPNTNVLTAFNRPGLHEYNQPRQVVSSIDLPNQQRYTFTYDNAGPNGRMQYGLITSLTLPSGARVDYTWGPGILSGTFSVTRRTVTLGTTVSVTDFSHSTVYGPLGNESLVVTATMPADSQRTRPQTIYTYDGYHKLTRVQYYASAGGELLKQLDMGYGGDVMPNEYDMHPLLTSVNTSVPSVSGGTLVSRREFDNDRVAFWLDPSDCSSSQEAEVGCENGFGNGTGNEGQAPTRYATYGIFHTSLGNVTAIREYDWGNGAPGALLRQTIRRYLYQDVPSYFSDFVQPNRIGFISTFPSYRALGNHVTKETLYDGSAVCSGVGTVDEIGAFQAPPLCSANKQAETTVTYDQGDPSTFGYYAEPTQISRWIGGTSYVSSGYLYDAHGNLIQARDPQGNVTTVDYTDSWPTNFSACLPTSASSAYPTVITNALQQRTQLTYSPCTGQKTAVAGPNDIAAGRLGTTYAYDLMNRMTDTYAPDGGHTQKIYNDSANTVETKQYLTGTGFVDKLDQMDGLGRVTQSALLSDPSGTDYVDTTYDGLGRVSSVSNAYRTQTDATYGTSTFTYDGLGRKTKTVQADGSTLGLQYDGNSVLTTDEAGLTWKRSSDALGRLTQVTEPGALTTGYVYDALGNLLGATQSGTATETPRLRAFNYDGLSRLTQSYNPETGTTSFQYLSNVGLCAGDVTLPCSKMDARGQTISYQYDPLNRLTSKSLNGSYLARYFYDGNYDPVSAPQLSGPDPNLVGRLSFVRASQPTGPPPRFAIGGYTTPYFDDQYFGYDAMGRLHYWTDAPPSVWGVDSNTVTAGYDLAGNMTAITYPNQLAITQTFDAAGRLQSVSPTGNSTFAYVKSIGYSPSGAPTQMVYGNGVTENLSQNSRLQPCEDSAFLPFALGAAMVLDHQYNYSSSGTVTPCGAAAGNNGNIYSIVDGTNAVQGSSSRNQTFTYDRLNRLASFDTAMMGGQARHQNFSYDSFGNLLSQASTVPPPNNPLDPLAFSASYGSNNRMLPSAFNCLPLSAGVTPQGVAGQVDVYDAAGNIGCSGIQATNARAYVWDGESRLSQLWTQQYNNTYSLAALYGYDAQGNRLRVDQMTTGANGVPQTSTFKEYSFFGGQMLAESDQTGAWTNYIYANGRKVARVAEAVPLLHFHGSNPQGWVECSAYFAFGLNYPIRRGDRLSWREYKSNAVGGLMEWFDSAYGNQWRAQDTDGITVNQDYRENQWVSRTVDLTPWEGHLLSSLSPLKDVLTPAATWEIWMGDVAIYSADGTVTPLIGSSGQAAPVGPGCQGPGSVGVEMQANGTAPAIAASGLNTHYYLADHLGSTQMEFTSAGYPLWKGQFAPFGQELDDPGTTANHYKFTGKERDTESGLDYFGARYYASNMGQWMSPDWSAKAEPVPYAKLDYPQSLNLYSYVLNNPVTHFDPDGHACGGPGQPPCLPSKDNRDSTQTVPVRVDKVNSVLPGNPAGHSTIQVGGDKPEGLVPNSNAKVKQSVEKEALSAMNNKGAPDPAPVAGHIQPPEASQKPLDSVTIYVTPDQASAMRATISQAMSSPQTFDPAYQNCTSFPQAVLQSGGVTVPSSIQTVTPGGLVQVIRSAQQPQN